MSHSIEAVASSAGVYPLGTCNVARMGYGAMQLQRFRGRSEAARAVLRHAVSLGIDHFDTAHFYGNGFVNEVIRDVAGEGHAMLVSTKVGAVSNPGGDVTVRPAQRPWELRAAVEQNLRSLGTEQLDLVNLRRLDVGPGLSAAGDQIVPIEDQLAVMIAMREEGKIGAIGLSAVDGDGLSRALPAGIACVQNAYSLLSRFHEPMLDVCVANSIAWVPFFPLGGAYFPEWPKVTEHPAVVGMAMREGVEPTRIALAWLLAHRPNIMLIPGTASLPHLEQNVASAALHLSQPMLDELDALGVHTITEAGISHG